MTFLTNILEFSVRHAKNMAYHACPTPIYSALEMIRFSGLREAQEAHSSLASRYHFYAELERWAAEPAPAEQRAEARERILAFIHASPPSNELDLSHLNLSSVPEGLATLTRLTTLNLSHNQLFHAPSQLGNLSNLVILDLSHNRLVALPSNMHQLANLQVLDLSQNSSLRQAPPNLALPGLHTFRFDAGLLDLPRGFEQQHARLLAVTQNMLLRWISEAPPAERAARNTAMQRILNRIARNDNTLELSDLNLSSLPDCDFLNQAVPIVGMLLRGNRLRELPPSFSRLNQLLALDLSNNEFSQIPPVVYTHLHTLRQLYIDDNKLTSIPDEIRNLRHLEWLTLRNNSLATFSPLYIELERTIPRLHLGGNSLSFRMDLLFHNLAKFFTCWRPPALPLRHLPPALAPPPPVPVAPPMPPPPAHLAPRPVGRPQLPPRPPHHLVQQGPRPDAPPLHVLPPAPREGLYPRLADLHIGARAGDPRPLPFNPAAPLAGDDADVPPMGPAPIAPPPICDLGHLAGYDAPFPAHFLVIHGANSFHAITLVHAMIGMRGLLNPMNRQLLDEDALHMLSEALALDIPTIRGIYNTLDQDQMRERFRNALAQPSVSPYVAQRRHEVLQLLATRDDWQQLLQ